MRELSGNLGCAGGLSTGESDDRRLCGDDKQGGCCLLHVRAAGGGDLQLASSSSCVDF